MPRGQLTPEQALQKLKHFCAYSERCHADVKQKLYDLGVRIKHHDEIIAALIEENYLNEERYALAFAAGKHRINQWGRIRISHALRQKQVSAYYISKALKGIEEKNYLDTLKKLVIEKYTALKNEQWLVRKKKTMDYLLQKGYEAALVNNVIKEITAQ